ncbi:MAG: hypothetical protein ACW98D_20520 [Promethearchaeota archaeon]
MVQVHLGPHQLYPINIMFLGYFIVQSYQMLLPGVNQKRNQESVSGNWGMGERETPYQLVVSL